MKNSGTNNFRPSNDSIREFIERYVEEYRRYFEESYPEQKDKFARYTSYPYYVTAYVGLRKTLIEYQPNMDKFVVQVKTVDEIPKIDRNKKYISAFRNDYLLRILDEPEKIARMDVLNDITFEELRREEAEYFEREYIEYVEEVVDSTVKNYISYIETAYNVRKETVSKERNEIYNIVTMIRNESNLMEVFLKARCSTLLDIINEIIQDVESSLFLATHGRYKPANALLRRLLETMIIALYFDSELRKYDRNSKTYEDVSSKRERWVERSRSLRFTGEYGILERLIDPDTDYIATEILRSTTKHFSKSSFIEYVEQLYGKLSKFVHYGGMRSLDEVSLEFAEFDEKRFREWYTRLNQIYEICNLLMAIKFPEILEIYEEIERKLDPVDQAPLLAREQVEALKKLLSLHTKSPN